MAHQTRVVGAQAFASAFEGDIQEAASPFEVDLARTQVEVLVSPCQIQEGEEGRPYLVMV